MKKKLKEKLSFLVHRCPVNDHLAQTVLLAIARLWVRIRECINL